MAPQFLGAWYVQAAVPIPFLHPEGVTCALSIYGEDGSRGTSIHDYHIQAGPTGLFIPTNLANLEMQLKRLSY